MQITPAETAAFSAGLVVIGGFLSKYLWPLLIGRRTNGKGGESSEYLTKGEHHSMCIAAIAALSPDIAFIKLQTASWNGQIKEVNETLQNLRGKVDEKMFDHEARIKSLEYSRQ